LGLTAGLVELLSLKLRLGTLCMLSLRLGFLSLVAISAGGGSLSSAIARSATTLFLREAAESRAVVAGPGEPARMLAFTEAAAARGRCGG